MIGNCGFPECIPVMPQGVITAEKVAAGLDFPPRVECQAVVVNPDSLEITMQSAAEVFIEYELLVNISETGMTGEIFAEKCS